MPLTTPRLAWALPGHEYEYCLNIPGYGLAEGEFIPQWVAHEIATALPTWRVENRGTRIEIANRTTVGTTDHPVVRAAVEQVVATLTDQPVTFVDVPADRAAHQAAQTASAH